MLIAAAGPTFDHRFSVSEIGSQSLMTLLVLGMQIIPGICSYKRSQHVMTRGPSYPGVPDMIAHDLLSMIRAQDPVIGISCRSPRVEWAGMFGGSTDEPRRSLRFLVLPQNGPP